MRLLKSSILFAFFSVITLCVCAQSAEDSLAIKTTALDYIEGYFHNDGKRMEILEIPSHKFYLGVQFHPEFNSRQGFPEESFTAFI